MGKITKKELSSLNVNDKETKEWIEDLLSEDYYNGFFDARENVLIVRGGVAIPYYKMRLICEYLKEVNDK